MTGTNVRVRGIKRWRDKKTGRWYTQHRKTGTMIKVEYGTGEFFAEVARLDGVAKVTASPKPGTLGMLIAAYRGSIQFTDLAERTKADYQRVFDYLKTIDDIAIVQIDTPF